MPKFILLCIAILGFSSCNASSEKPYISDSQNSINSASTTTTEQLLDENGPIITFETQGSSCNLCATVKISVFADGRALYEHAHFEAQKDVKPLNFVKRETTESRRITKEQLDLLIEKFDEMKFFALADKYIPVSDSNGHFVSSPNCPQSLSDGPTFHIYFRKGSQSKNVDHYDSCEPDANAKKLPELEQMIGHLFDIRSELKKSFLSNTNTGPTFGHL